MVLLVRLPCMLNAVNTMEQIAKTIDVKGLASLSVIHIITSCQFFTKSSYVRLVKVAVEAV